MPGGVLTQLVHSFVESLSNGTDFHILNFSPKSKIHVHTAFPAKKIDMTIENPPGEDIRGYTISRPTWRAGQLLTQHTVKDHQGVIPTTDRLVVVEGMGAMPYYHELIEMFRDHTQYDPGV